MELDVNAVINDLSIQIANLTKSNALLRAENQALKASLQSKAEVQEETQEEKEVI